jgi:hypothetical protein
MKPKSNRKWALSKDQIAGTAPRFVAILIIMSCCAAVGCSRDPAQPLSTARQPSGEKPAKIVVTEQGAVYLNEREVPIDDLEAEVRELGNSIDCFWYHRELPQADEPHPNALKVIEIMAGFELPIALYFDRQFTQRVGPTGN